MQMNGLPTLLMKYKPTRTRLQFLLQLRTLSNNHGLKDRQWTQLFDNLMINKLVYSREFFENYIFITCFFYWRAEKVNVTVTFLGTKLKYILGYWPSWQKSFLMLVCPRLLWQYILASPFRSLSNVSFMISALYIWNSAITSLLNSIEVACK